MTAATKTRMSTTTPLVTPLVYTTAAQAERVTAAYLSRPDEPVYFDTETTGLDPHSCALVSIQVQQAERAPVIFDCRVGAEPVLALTVALRPVFSKLLIVGHNLKFDLQFLLANGISLPTDGTRLFDTQIAEQLIYGLGMEAARKEGTPMGLAYVAARRLGLDMSKAERKWFYEPAPLDQRPDEWNAPFPDEEVEYMALDVSVLPGIHAQQQRALAERGLGNVFKIEMGALPVLARAEYRGILVDVDGWRSFIAEKAVEAKGFENEALAVLGPPILNERIKAYDADMLVYEQVKGAEKQYEVQLRAKWERDPCDGGEEPVAWGSFKQVLMKTWRDLHKSARPKLDLSIPNIGSTQQLTAAMTALGIPVPTKRNDKGEMKPTTESTELEKLADSHPAMAKLVAYRKASKFVDSFGESLLEKVNPNTRRIHPTINPIGASTGRMSSSNPNWQQIPSKGDGDKLRALVHPAEGCVLLTADFSNIEMRILAELSLDQTLLDMFASGQDLHSYTARVMFALDADVDPKATVWKRDLTYRAIAKIINYGLVYGMSASKLAKDTGINLDDAKQLLATYFETFPGVRVWLDEQKRDVLKTWKSVTLAGRVRYYSDPGQEPNFYGYQNEGRAADYRTALDEWKKQRAQIQRQATNTPIQGLSADITKYALALFHKRTDPRMAVVVAVVHDEIVVETPKQHAVVIAAHLSKAMTDAAKFFLRTVTIPDAEVHAGERWAH